jgi:hypothetical protein
MAYPATLLEKKNAAYVGLSNDIASESAATVDHDKRLALAKQMASLNPSFDAYVTVDLAVQGYSDATSAADVKNRISALITNLVALGF